MVHAYTCLRHRYLLSVSILTTQYINKSFFLKECEASDQVLPKKIPIPSCHILLLCIMCVIAVMIPGSEV